MLQKLFTFLILSMFLIMGVSRAQQPPPPVLGPGEKWTDLWSVSYDFQTNGSVRYLQQDPSNPNNWCAILMAQQDSTTAVGTQRYIYYAYSDNGGTTWTSNVLDVSSSMGFPCLTLSNGIPVIAAHRSAALGTFVFKDLQFGGFSFVEITGVPTIGASNPIWPHIAGTANGNLVMAAAPNPAQDGYWTTYNGTTWTPYSSTPLISGPSGNFDVGANGNGRASIVGVDALGTTANPGAMSLYSSNDNGATFDAGNVIFTYVIDGNDTLFANVLGGYQIVYVGDEPHIVFAAFTATATVFPNVNTTEFVKPRIYHWSQSTGLDMVAGRHNIPSLTDTITQDAVPLFSPTFSRTFGGKLVCAFTTFLVGNTQVVNNGDVVNCGEIFVGVSNDNGNTWSAPSNITNTPNIDEKFSSLAPLTSSDSLRIFYLRDLKAGDWVVVPEWGIAPVYGIFKTAPLPVGIKENVTQAKSYELFQNYPNPFNPTTTISYYVEKTGFVSLKVYDALGREVASLVSGIQSQGPKEITFTGDKLSSGIYYYSITTGDFKATKKMMLIK